MGEFDEDDDSSWYDCDGEDDADEFAFECAAYWTGKEWHCPLAGTEECDWECTDAHHPASSIEDQP